MDRPPTSGVDLQIAGVGAAVELRATGSAHLYRAPHTGFGHDVVIKVVAGSRGRAARVRFEREQQAMTRLSTVDGILPLLEAGSTVDGDLYLMAPHVEGPSMQDRLAVGPLSWDDAAAVMEQVAYTMHHAHVVGVVHRDLKPSTIVVEDGTGRVVVTELGFVGLTMDATADVDGHGGDLVFTPGYSPPEAYRPGRPTLQTDIYAMGATLWALIAGRPPFTGAAGDDDMADVIERTETCRAGDLRRRAPAAVVAVIDQAMAHDPADRHDSAATFARALRHARTTGVGFVADLGAAVAGWRPSAPVAAVGVDSGAASLVTHPPLAESSDVAVAAAAPAPAADPPIDLAPDAAAAAAGEAGRIADIATPAGSFATAEATSSLPEVGRTAPIRPTLPPAISNDDAADDQRRASILVGAGVAAIAAVALAASVVLIAVVDDTSDPVRISGPVVESDVDTDDPDATAGDPAAPTPEVLGVEVEADTDDEGTVSTLRTPLVIPTPTATTAVVPTATPNEVISAPPPPTATPDEVISAPPPPRPTATALPTVTPRPTAQPTATAAVPTATVAPTATSAPVATATSAPAPTATAAPSPTP